MSAAYQSDKGRAAESEASKRELTALLAPRPLITPPMSETAAPSHIMAPPLPSVDFATRSTSRKDPNSGIFTPPESSTGTSTGKMPSIEEHGDKIEDLRTTADTSAKPSHCAKSTALHSPQEDEDRANMPPPKKKRGRPAGRGANGPTPAKLTSYARSDSRTTGVNVNPNPGQLPSAVPAVPTRSDIPPVSFGCEDINAGNFPLMMSLCLWKDPSECWGRAYHYDELARRERLFWVQESAEPIEYPFKVPRPFPTEYFDLCATPCAAWRVVVRELDSVLGILVNGVVIPVGQPLNPIKAIWHAVPGEWRLQFQFSKIGTYDLDLRHFREEITRAQSRGDTAHQIMLQEMWANNCDGAWITRSEELIMILGELGKLVYDQDMSVVPGFTHQFNVGGDLITFSTPTGSPTQGGPSHATQSGAIPSGPSGHHSNIQPDLLFTGEDFAIMEGAPTIDPTLSQAPPPTAADVTMRPDQMHIPPTQPTSMSPAQNQYYHSTEHHRAMETMRRQQDYPHLADAARGSQDSMIDAPPLPALSFDHASLSAPLADGHAADSRNLVDNDPVGTPTATEDEDGKLLLYRLV
ncbi:hypothetical protein LTR85_011798 [Meristemomyces frigidus]|nr:hypothetical protein LTR85_011798 [Meristemomyces frigidus]